MYVIYEVNDVHDLHKYNLLWLFNFNPSLAYNQLDDLPPSTPLITSQPKVQYQNQLYGQPQQQ